SWEPHVVLELEAFEGHFRGRPYLDKLRFRLLSDELARLNEFEIGNLESVNEIPDDKYDAIKANPSFPGVIEERPTLSTFYIAFNTTRKPFDNILVRQAFNYAARPEVMLDVIRHGRGTRAHGVLPPGMPAYDPSLAGYGHDREKALALLKQAGYGDPKQLGVIEYWYNATSPTDPNAKLAEVFQQNLQELGIETKLQSCDWGTYRNKVDRGELAMFRGSWFADYPDPDNFLYILFHSSMHGQAGNTSFYANPKVDELLLQGRTCPDPARRMTFYRSAEEIVVREAPWVFLYHSRSALLRKPYVRGLRLNAIGPDATKMRGVWLDERAGQ
ncbi:MAG: ABC transporter substrate-binding protein, partial [Candidatus Wallbacteria bacterium]|nr:ABC transporter substrate-binding protein [Candidatus Wallbacteria bacterium]